MKNDTGKTGVGAMLALIPFLALPAVAQIPELEPAADAAETAAAEDTETGRSTSGPVMEEIIVTARRVEERLQDVPVSMTVFNQQQLSNRNVLSGTDLATYTPSLTANSRYGSDNASFSIRGFSQEIRTTASVGLYFADVVSARGGGSTPGGDGAGPGAFFDLQNVQVLKGPQGTLFGRNTTGGAILLVPRKPTDEYEGYVEQSLGDFDLRRTQVVVNAPLSDWARMRLGADRQYRGGYLDNVSGIGPDHFNDVDYTALRASLVVDVTDTIENYTIASSTESSNNGPMPRIFAFDGNPDPVTGRLRSLAGFAAAQIARQADAGYYAVQNADPRANVRLDHWQVINTTTWAARDTLTVKNIVSYAELTNSLRTELFGSNFFIPRPDDPSVIVPLSFVNSRPAPGLDTSDQSTFTEEFQLQGAALGGALDWQAGVYYENSRPVERSGTLSPQTISCFDSDNFECYDVLGASQPLPGGGTAEGFVGSLNSPTGKIEYENLGIYTQGTYAITDTLKGTAGLRFTEDQTEAEARYVIWRFPSENTPVAFCGSTLTAVGTRTPVTGDLSQCDVAFGKKKTSAPTWVLGLDYNPSGNTMWYGKYSRGYRQGSLSPFGADGFNYYDEERVDTYELGVKTSFESVVSGSFNAAVFYNDFTDQQILVGFSASNNSVSPNVSAVNAASSRIYGLELDSQLFLFDGFTLDLNYAYLDTKLEELRDIVLPADSIYDQVQLPTTAGSDLTYTPKHKGTITASYQLPMSPTLGTMTTALTYAYTDEQLISKSSAFGVLPSYELVNLNLNWMGIVGGPVDLSVFVTNLLDEEYFAAIAGSWASAGFEAAYVGAPRMIGARVKLNFGA